MHTRTTGTTDTKRARQKAQKFFSECLIQKGLGDGTLPLARDAVRKSQVRFDRIVDRWLDELALQAGDDERRLRHWKDCRGSALGKTGFATYFGKVDVNTITPERIQQFIAFKQQKSATGKLAQTTIKRNIVLLNVALKHAYHARLLDRIPLMPKVKTKDNPRAWFEHDEYKRLHIVSRNKARPFRRKGDLMMAGHWEELSDFIIFMVASFLRPGEWPDLRQRHVKVVNGLNAHLELTVTRSKTTQRRSVTMGPAVKVFERIEQDDPVVSRVLTACSAGYQIQSSVSDPTASAYSGQEYRSAETSSETSSTETNSEAPPPANAYSFADFPVTPSIINAVEPQFDGAQKDFRSFRTRIKTAVTEGPVFAGHIAIAQFGCGTSCRSGLAIDLSTGNIVNLPLGGEQYPGSEWQVQKDSRLIKVIWSDFDADPKCHGQGYFEWNGSDFKQLAITDFPSGCSGQN